MDQSRRTEHDAEKKKKVTRTPVRVKTITQPSDAHVHTITRYTSSVTHTRADIIGAHGACVKAPQLQPAAGEELLFFFYNNHVHAYVRAPANI